MKQIKKRIKPYAYRRGRKVVQVPLHKRRYNISTKSYGASKLPIIPGVPPSVIEQALKDFREIKKKNPNIPYTEQTYLEEIIKAKTEAIGKMPVSDIETTHRPVTYGPKKVDLEEQQIKGTTKRLQDAKESYKKILEQYELGKVKVGKVTEAEDLIKLIRREEAEAGQRAVDEAKERYKKGESTLEQLERELSRIQVKSKPFLTIADAIDIELSQMREDAFKRKQEVVKKKSEAESKKSEVLDNLQAGIDELKGEIEEKDKEESNVTVQVTGGGKVIVSKPSDEDELAEEILGHININLNDFDNWSKEQQNIFFRKLKRISRKMGKQYKEVELEVAKTKELKTQKLEEELKNLKAEFKEFKKESKKVKAVKKATKAKETKSTKKKKTTKAKKKSTPAKKRGRPAKKKVEEIKGWPKSVNSMEIRKKLARKQMGANIEFTKDEAIAANLILMQKENEAEEKRKQQEKETMERKVKAHKKYQKSMKNKEDEIKKKNQKSFLKQQDKSIKKLKKDGKSKQ